MKKLFLLAVYLFAVVGLALASVSDDKPIQITELPSAAQQFVKKHFAKSKVLYVTEDRNLMGKDYKVVFANGNSVEFDKKGVWSDVECKEGGVPVAIIPSEIVKEVKERHADQKIKKIEKDRSGYDVKLSSGLELKFDRAGKFIRYDD